MGAGQDKVCHKVVFSCGQTGYSLAASLLRLVCVSRDPLQISQVCQRYSYLFFLDQVSFVELIGSRHDLGPSLVAPFFLDLQQLVFYYSHQLFLVCEKALVVSDLSLELCVFVFYLLSFKTLQSCQSHVQYSLGLYFRKGKTLHEFFLGVVVALADGLYDCVDIVKSDPETFQYVSSGLRLLKVELCSSCDYVLLVLQIFFQDLVEIQHSRLAVYQGDHDHAEVVLHLCVLEQSVQRDLRIGVFLQFDDDPHAGPAGLVSYI